MTSNGTSVRPEQRTLEHVRRVMSGRPRIVDYPVLRHRSIGVPRLPPDVEQDVRELPARVEAECASALEAGLLQRRDVLAIAISRACARILCSGPLTAATLEATRKAAVGMFLLVHGGLMIELGWAPRGQSTVDGALSHADLEFRAWMREVGQAAAKHFGTSLERSRWLAAGLDGALREEDDDAAAQRTWNLGLERTATRLRRRRRLVFDSGRASAGSQTGQSDGATSVESALWIAVKAGQWDGAFAWNAGTGISIDPNRAADAIAPEFPLAMPAPVEADHREVPPHGAATRGAKGLRRARRRRREAHDRELRTGSRVVAERGDNDELRSTYATAEDVAHCADARETVDAVLAILERRAANRRSNDRVASAALVYFQEFARHGSRPNARDLAIAMNVDPGSLSRRIRQWERELQGRVPNWGDALGA